MGVFSWLSKAAKRIAPAIGKSVQRAGALYDKGKSAYSQIKGTLSALPVVGQIADQVVKKAEMKANDYIQSKTGLTLNAIDTGIEKGRNLVNQGVNMASSY
jgi:hypothetical protein